MERLIFLGLLVVALTACSTHEIRYVPFQCPDMERPDIPQVSEEKLDLMGEEAKTKILVGERMYQQMIEDYEAICERFQQLAEEARDA